MLEGFRSNHRQKSAQICFRVYLPANTIGQRIYLPELAGFMNPDSHRFVLQALDPDHGSPVLEAAFFVSEIEHLCAGARVTNPTSRNILEKCGFQWHGVELHRFAALGSSTPVDRFKLSRGVWASLKNWGNSTKRER